MNEALTIALIQAELDGDTKAVEDILKLANDPDALKAAVQSEPGDQKKGGGGFADNGDSSSSFLP